MHLAVQNKHVTSVKFLMALGAAINVVDAEGMTPLHHSVKGKPSSESAKISASRALTAEPRMQKAKPH